MFRVIAVLGYQNCNKYLVTGSNHAACYKQFAQQGLLRKDRDSNEQVGFVTTEGRFVKRKEAYLIAKDAGQLILENPKQELFSEYCNMHTN